MVIAAVCAEALIGIEMLIEALADFQILNMKVELVVFKINLLDLDDLKGKVS